MKKELCGMKSKNQTESESGIILLAKKYGKTSFSSLSSVKHALGTGKVGHTGTLDSFADGLLVVLSGRLTRLVPHITNFDKKYVALIEFGEETDTLDPTGSVIKSGGRIPTESELRAAISSFVGEIEQVPPLFSALHVDGKRASDLARTGKEAELPARKITIFDIKLLDFKGKYALVEVHCSKGTYIRALARDIAKKCGTFAHLYALRRTKVGPFELSDAVGYSELDDFTIDSLLEHPRTFSFGKSGENENTEKKDTKNNEVNFEAEHAEIRANLKQMTFSLAEYCGLHPVLLSSHFVESFSNGKPLNSRVFSGFFKNVGKSEVEDDAELAVFYPKGKFAGIVVKNGDKFSYGFVIPPNKDFTIYTWEQVVNGEFSSEFKNAGTAITIGSFDGPHIGHDALFDSALSQRTKNLVPGIVTFTKSLRALKNPAVYPGDISSLAQKLEILAAKGFSFAIVIDFSPEFAKIEGTEFLKKLIDLCGMKHLSEGKDFHCGYNGSTDMQQIADFSIRSNFTLQTIDSVMYEERKVSSSRIRDCILNADFHPVEAMLEHPFVLDCSGFDWKWNSVKIENSENSENHEKTELVAKKIGIQILPPDGSYKVSVIMSVFGSPKNQNCRKSGEVQSTVSVRAYRSDCMLENGIIRLSFSNKLIGGFVRAVRFDCPD